VARLRALPEIVAQHGELIVERDPARPTGRLLRHGQMDSSYVDLADVTHLEFEYMRWLRIVLRAAHARRVLHIGGAACALPRALAAEWPGGRQEVCEIDAQVLEVARAHLGLRRARGLRVRHVEGRAHLGAQADDSWQAVVIDAFAGEGGGQIPHALITVQAATLAARVAPLTLVNVVDDRAARVVNRVSAAFATAYPLVWTLSGRIGNTIVVAGRTPLPLERIAAAAAADPAPPKLTGPAATARQILSTPPLHDDR
jgi:spermidine synthase